MASLAHVLSCTTSGPTQTRIVATLGPASRSVQTLEELLRAGMNVARFNFSHGSHEYHLDTLQALRQAQQNTGIMCATLLDTKGPEIRTGALKGGLDVTYKAGLDVTLTTDYATEGDAGVIAISYKGLARDVAPGGTILIADGSLSLVVLSCDEAAGTVRARCTSTATIGERKNCNLPGVIVDLPTVTEKDKDDLLNWGAAHGVDFIAPSFVRKGSDIAHVRALLGRAGEHIKIIAKIENQEGLTNFDEILAAADGIMVARGDLGMEIATSKVFLAQKLMAQQCNLAGKPVITATQMLESMIKNPRPTRAEATDVANAVLDGTDCVMLSGETAAGAYPVEAVRVVSRICREAEASLDYSYLFRTVMAAAQLPMSPLESLASSAVRTAHKVRAALIVVLTRGGSTARLVAKYRPNVPVICVAVPVLATDGLNWQCSGEAPARQALLTRGLIPVLAEGSARATDNDTTSDLLGAAIAHARTAGLCSAGDCVVALHRIGHASVIKISQVKA